MAGGLVLPITTMFNDKGLKQAQSAFKKFGGVVKGGLAAVGLSLGVGALVNGLNDMTKAAVEDAKSQALLANQLKNTVKASDEVTASVEAQITKMSLMSSVADDKIRPAFSSLIRSTRSVKDATRLTNLALDISTATGKDLTAVSLALGKAYNGNTASLSKLGIKVKDTKKPFDELEKAFAGSAETAANNDPYQRLAVIFDELKETIGKQFIPALNLIADWFTENFDAVNKFFDDAFQSDVFKAIVDLGKTLYEQVLVPLGDWFTDTTFQDALAKFSDGFTLLADGITDFIETPIVDFLLGMTTTAITGGLNILAEALTKVGAALKIISTYEDTFLLVTGQKKAPKGTEASKKSRQALSSLQSLTGINFDDLISGFMKVPGYATGGVIPARPGGTLARIGEGGQSEAVIPLDRLDAMMRPAKTGGSVYQITVNAGIGDKAAIGKAVVDAVKSYERQSGAGWRQ